MTLEEMRKQALFQFNNDTDVLDDFDYMPHVNEYVNAGYDLLMYAWREEPAPKLTYDTEVPVLPEWAHKGIVDYATYLLYRNGSSARQGRGQEYLRAFAEVQERLRSGGKAPKHFFNIPDTVDSIPRDPIFQPAYNPFE